MLWRLEPNVNFMQMWAWCKDSAGLRETVMVLHTLPDRSHLSQVIWQKPPCHWAARALVMNGK